MRAWGTWACHPTSWTDVRHSCHVRRKTWASKTQSTVGSTAACLSLRVNLYAGNNRPCLLTRTLESRSATRHSLMAAWPRTKAFRSAPTLDWHRGHKVHVGTQSQFFGESSSRRMARHQCLPLLSCYPSHPQPHACYPKKSRPCARKNKSGEGKHRWEKRSDK